jgi:glycosyltransferase involved in cell wall biosynthesis
MGLNTCFYFNRSKPFVDSGGGGRRRTHQVFEALRALGPCEFITAVISDRQTHRKLHSRFRMYCRRHFVTGGEYKLWSPDRRAALYRLRAIARDWVKKGPDLSSCSAAVVEDPIYFKPLVRKLKELGIPVIASCQNIESLSYGQVSFKNKKDIFVSEIDTLALCDLAITISREDTWLLNCFNIRTFYFPYYPPQPVRDRMLAIRSNRKNNKKESIILLGNAGNIATRKGMHKAAEYWQANNLESLAGKLLIAGYETDIHFKNIKSYPGIEFCGPLANDELDKKLASVKACLCYQEEGGGALTRIGEMLLAGVPVLANTNSARSYYNLTGVIEFRDLPGLAKALQQADRFDVEIPRPAEPDRTALVDEIKRITAAK